MRTSFIRSNKFFVFLLIIYSGIIFYVSSKPMPAESGMVALPYFDKILHGFEFFFFALLFFLSLPDRGESYLHLSVVIIVSAVYGGFIELYQSRIPTRSMSIADWYADLIGVFLASLIWLYVKKYVNNCWSEENR